MQLLSVNWVHWIQRASPGTRSRAGAEGKLIPGPLAACSVRLRGAVTCSLDGPVLPVPETQLAEEQTKQLHPSLTQVLSCKALWSMGGCASASWATERNKLAFLQDTSEPQQHNGLEILPCNGGPFGP